MLNIFRFKKDKNNKKEVTGLKENKRKRRFKIKNLFKRFDKIRKKWSPKDLAELFIVIEIVRGVIEIVKGIA